MLEPRPAYEIIPAPDPEVPAAPLARRPSVLAALGAGVVWIVRELGPELLRAWQASRLAPPAAAPQPLTTPPAEPGRRRRRHGVR